MPIDYEKLLSIAARISEDPDIEYGKGGKIYIKPSHRGRFSALLKRTGKTASWYKAHGTPAQKKMATFALNARKWKHEDGGFLQEYPDGGRIKGRRNGKFFVTELGDNRERKFQDWYANAASVLGLNPDPDAYEHAYDYRGYWLNNKNADVSAEDFHFPDTWKQPHHPTFSDESIYAKGREGVGHWEGETFVPGSFNNLMQATESAVPVPEVVPEAFVYNPEDVLLRQRYAESAFNNKAKSGAGAMGAYQIMPNTLKGYVDATGDVGDIYDYEYNKRVRDHVMDTLLRSRTVSGGDPTDEVKYAKQLAAYNWGVGNLGKYLEKLKNAGTDIYQSLDWMEGLPKETRDYVNFILFKKGEGSRSEDAFNSARARANMKDGGLLRNFFEYGGPEWNSDWRVSYPEAVETAEVQVTVPAMIDAGTMSVNKNAAPKRKTIQRKDTLLSDGIDVQKDTYMLRAPLGTDTIEKTKVTIPDRNQSEYFRSATESIEYPNGAFKPEGKTRDDIMARQRELADAGMYSSQLNNLSREEVKQIQQKLVSRGLLSNEKRSDGSYKEVDGIVGDKTRAAWNKYNIDGIWGARSDQAENSFANVNRNMAPTRWADFYSAKGIDGCAKWVTRKFESVLGNVSKQNGVIGSAWQMPKNIVNAGGEMLFNLYDSPEFRSGVKDEGDLKAKTKKALSDANLDLMQLQPGDVVGIFYPASHSYSEAINNGTTYNTHVAIVTGYDDDGMPIVEHNMGGNNKKDRADKLQYGAKITVAARPKQAESVKEYPFKSGSSEYYVDKFGEGSQPDNLRAYMDSMAGAAPVIGQIYNNADMDAVQRIATAVLKRETGYMQRLESQRTGLGAAKEAGEKVMRAMQGKTPETKSSDIAKFKLNTLTADERNFLGIHSKDDLENPEKAGLAAELVLAKNYDYFVRYAKQNPDFGITQQDIEDLTALSYNQGMSKLYNITKSKLEALRRNAESDEILYDMDATDLGKLAKAIPITEPVAKILYDIGIGTRSTSYMNSVRKAIQDEIKRRSGE